SVRIVVEKALQGAFHCGWLAYALGWLSGHFALGGNSVTPWTWGCNWMWGGIVAGLLAGAARVIVRAKVADYETCRGRRPAPVKPQHGPLVARLRAWLRP